MIAVIVAVGVLLVPAVAEIFETTVAVVAAAAVGVRLVLVSVLFGLWPVDNVDLYPHQLFPLLLPPPPPQLQQFPGMTCVVL